MKTHYLEAGEGETLLLIHGGGLASCAEVNYGDVIGPLSKNFRVLALDIAGYGLTPGRDPQDFSNEAQGRFIIKFLDALGVKKTHLAGNSNGGWMIEFVAHERHGLLYRPGSAKAAANQVETLLSDDRFRHRCGDRARKDILACHSPQRALEVLAYELNRITA